MAVIGDSPLAQEETVAASLPQSLITEIELIDEDSYVNDSNKSGKKIGATYYIEGTVAGTMDIVIASGPLKNDPWSRLSGEGLAADLALTVAGDVGDAAGITVQLNLIENKINAILAGSIITPA